MCFYSVFTWFGETPDVRVGVFLYISHSLTSILPAGGQTNTWKCNLFYKSPRAESTVHNTAFMVYVHFQLQVMCPLQVWSSGWRHDGASNFHVGEEKTWKKASDFWLGTGNKQALPREICGFVTTLTSPDFCSCHKYCGALSSQGKHASLKWLMLRNTH